MHQAIARLSISTLALAAVTSPVASTEENSIQPATRLPEEALQALGEEVAGWVANGNPVGAEILIIRNGTTVFHEAYGWSDRDEKRPLGRNSIYRMRSMTKPITGTAVLMLVEDGKIALDDPVSRFLPSFDNERSQAVTVSQLLTHTSGLGDHGSEDIGLRQDDHDYANLRQLVDEIGEIGPSNSPGTYHYSDSGSATLGAIVEQVSGMPVEQFIEERILRPLEMDDTYTKYEPDANWSDRVNSTYVLREETCEFDRYWDRSMEQDENFFEASGGLYSTIVDYAKFLSAWMGDGITNVRLLSRDTIRKALTPVSEQGDGQGYGMHWSLFSIGKQHKVPSAFGHGGSDGTVAIAIPGMDIMILYFTQSRGSASQGRFRDQLARLGLTGDVFQRDHLAEEIDAQWDTITASVIPDDGHAATGSQHFERNLSKYVGTYVHPQREHKVMLEDSGLVYSFGNPREPAPLLPVSEGVFLMAHPCQGIKARVTFDVDDQGGAVGYKIDTLRWQGEFKRKLDD